jgi:hypothetical protein
LGKLGAITIDKSEFAGKSAESTTFSCTLDESSSQATLSKVYRKGSERPQTSLKHYQITRKTLKGLARDEHRDCNAAEVVLAFPLDGQSEPIISPQEVYAYLPIGNFGFSVSGFQILIYTRLTTCSFLSNPTSLRRPAGRM